MLEIIFCNFRGRLEKMEYQEKNNFIYISNHICVMVAEFNLFFRIQYNPSKHWIVKLC